MLTSSDQLRGLAGPVGDYSIRPKTEPAAPAPAAREPWLIPRPADGFAYTYAELAGLAGVKIGTVRAWISRGRVVDGRAVKLEPIRIPQGRIAPPALCRFLSVVNGLDVRVDSLLRRSGLGCEGRADSQR